MDKALPSTGDICQELRSCFEVPVGVLDTTVAKVGGQGHHMAGNRIPSLWTRLECPRRKGITEVMQARVRLTRPSVEFQSPYQSLERIPN